MYTKRVCMFVLYEKGVINFNGWDWDIMLLCDKMASISPYSQTCFFIIKPLPRVFINTLLFIIGKINS